MSEFLSRLRRQLKVVFSAERQPRAVDSPSRSKSASPIPRAKALRTDSVSQDVFYPASPGQSRLWYLNQIGRNSPVYSVPAAWEIRGKLDVSHLEQALRDVIQRHAVLRTTFLMEGGDLLQRVAATASPDFHHRHLESVSEELRSLTTDRWITEEVSRPFDLSSGPLMRMRLLTMGSEHSVLLANFHHICIDGWSLAVFWKDLELAYSASRLGQPVRWKELPAHYADYAIWQRDRWQSGQLQTQLSYWKQTLAQLPVPELPTDRPPPAAPTTNGAHVDQDLPETLTSAVKEMGRQEGVTLFMMSLAALQILLHKCTGQLDVAIGTPIAGRTHRSLEALIGFFVNTLVIRTQLSNDPTFRELLARVRDNALDAYAHQDIPFEKLVEELAPTRSSSTNPLFGAMLVIENGHPAVTTFAGLPSRPVSLYAPGSKFDLMLTVIDKGSTLRTIWDYNPDVFDEATIHRLTKYYRTILEKVTDQPEERIRQISLLTPEERHRLLHDWNGPITDYPRDLSIHQIFELQAKHRPNSVALRFQEQSLSYDALNRRANRLARELQQHGVIAGTLVGISIERSIEAVLGVLAILKAGGAYVPIDPEYPTARLAFLLHDAQLTLLLTQAQWKHKLVQALTRLICLEDLSERPNPEWETDLEYHGDPESPAYVNYTSGSTGEPKGVVVPHRAVVRLVKSTNYVTLNAQSILLHAAPLSFDAATFELWGALLNGGCSVILPPGKHSLADIGEAVRNNHVETLWLTAGLFHLMAEQRLEDLKPLRQLLAGGDVLSPEWVRTVYRALPDCRVINGYGPTENTTFTCCHIVSNEQEITHHVPIGRPIANTQVYILDDDLQLVPVGVEGELYAGGDGVALGYLNRPALTAERFIADPFRSAPGALLYRTGDRARWQADGTIEFRGRRDHQIKVRGFRVELGEIESLLSTCPGVRGCAVVSIVDPTAGNRICAFVATEDQSSIAEGSLRNWLAQRVPDYMVPSQIGVLPALPLSANGKVDRRALAALATQPRAASDASTMLPADPLENQLTTLWRQVLRREDIGRESHFFDLGGHSMLALRLFSEIENQLKVRLPLATLFQAPTVSKLAQVLRESGWTPPWQSLVAIQREGNRAPLFLIHGIGGNVVGFHDLALGLGPDQPVFGVQSPGLDGQSPLLDRVEEMAARYVQEIIAVYPQGPYHLCGLSFGGVIAFEMARQLRDQGHAIGVLALLDTHPPGHAQLLPLQQRAREQMTAWRNRVNGHLRDLTKRADWKAYLQKKAKTLRRRLRSRIWQWRYQTYASRGEGLPRNLRNVKEANTLAAQRYVVKPYEGKVTLLLAAEHAAPIKDSLRRSWTKIALGGLEVHEVPGDHVTLIAPPHSAVLAKRLRQCLDEATRTKHSSQTDAPRQPS